MLDLSIPFYPTPPVKLLYFAKRVFFLKVCSKICIHQVGHGNMMKNSNEKIANDLANLIDITVEVQQISPDDIIICGIIHRDDQKVHTTNKLLSSVCIRKGCKFLVPDAITIETMSISIPVEWNCGYHKSRYTVARY